MSVSARTSRLTLSRPTSASSSPSTALDVRVGFSGSDAATSGSCSVVRCPGIAPSSPGEEDVVCTADSRSAGGRRLLLSSLVQSSTTGPVPEPASGPASANS